MGRCVRIVLTQAPWEDYLHWQAHDAEMIERLDDLIRECLRDPFQGAGKPEPLSGVLGGWWSRRINGEHRLIYRVSGTGAERALEIAQCRYHY